VQENMQEARQDQEEEIQGKAHDKERLQSVQMQKEEVEVDNQLVPGQDSCECRDN
jgi:hypothetical protein